MQVVRLSVDPTHQQVPGQLHRVSYSTGSRPCPMYLQWAERVIEAAELRASPIHLCAHSKHGSATVGGYRQPTQRIPLVTRDYCTTGCDRTSTTQHHYFQDQAM